MADKLPPSFATPTPTPTLPASPRPAAFHAALSPVSTLEYPGVPWSTLEHRGVAAQVSFALALTHLKWT